MNAHTDLSFIALLNECVYEPVDEVQCADTNLSVQSGMLVSQCIPVKPGLQVQV